MAALLACTAMLGTGTAFADTLVKNLGKGTSGATHDLSATDASQAFTTGSTADAYELTGVKVQFGTAPTSTATVSAIITDGQAVTDNIVATLTNPGTWATTSTFAVPSGITLDASTTYYLIIDATDGILATTSSNSEDSGGVTGWSIADSRTKRAMVSDSGLGGTWGPSSNTLKIAVEGDHKGTVTACSAASMADRVWAGSMTAGKFAFGNETLFGWNPTGTFSGSNLTDDDFSFAGETYTFESIYWGVAVGETVGELLIAFADMAAGDIATKATRDSLILHVGNNRFNLGDGTYNTGSRGVTWSNTNLNWNQYDRVCLAVPPGRTRADRGREDRVHHPDVDSRRPRDVGHHALRVPHQGDHGGHVFELDRYRRRGLEHRWNGHDRKSHQRHGLHRPGPRGERRGRRRGFDRGARDA